MVVAGAVCCGALDNPFAHVHVPQAHLGARRLPRAHVDAADGHVRCRFACWIPAFVREFDLYARMCASVSATLLTNEADAAGTELYTAASSLLAANTTQNAMQQTYIAYGTRLACGCGAAGFEHVVAQWEIHNPVDGDDRGVSDRVYLEHVVGEFEVRGIERESCPAVTVVVECTGALHRREANLLLLAHLIFPSAQLAGRMLAHKRVVVFADVDNHWNDCVTVGSLPLPF